MNIFYSMSPMVYVYASHKAWLFQTSELRCAFSVVVENSENLLIENFGQIP